MLDGGEEHSRRVMSTDTAPPSPHRESEVASSGSLALTSKGPKEPRPCRRAVGGRSSLGRNVTERPVLRAPPEPRIQRNKRAAGGKS